MWEDVQHVGLSLTPGCKAKKTDAPPDFTEDSPVFRTVVVLKNTVLEKLLKKLWLQGKPKIMTFMWALDESLGV